MSPERILNVETANEDYSVSKSGQLFAKPTPSASASHLGMIFLASTSVPEGSARFSLIRALQRISRPSYLTTALDIVKQAPTRVPARNYSHRETGKLMSKNENEDVNEIALLTASNIEAIDKIGVALVARDNPKSTGNLAADDSVAQGLFRGNVSRRDTGTLQEDQQTGPMLGKAPMQTLALEIVGLLGEQVVELLLNRAKRER